MHRLSRPLTDLREHYEVIVVGSGYGGSIAACRLSRAGRKVAVLERGRELHPGEYPTTMAEAGRQLQASAAEGETGDPRDLYWFHVGADINVFSGCGLGGTSLVNANVSLTPDQRIFDDVRWPQALRADREGLDAGYARARAMLTPTTYPTSFPPLAKMEALRVAADGAPWYPTPINVTFRAGPNAAGVHQEACTGCGDCVTGCNYGAKNTLLMNYLPDAVAHGAEIFSEIDVHWVERAQEHLLEETGGRAMPRWVVRAEPLGTGRDRFEAPPLAITADFVVLAAGTLGTSRVLLRSRQHGLETSACLGRRFSGNGDVLGFSLRRRRPVRAVGSGHHAPDRTQPAGPTITSVIDRREGLALEDGIIIEDAVVPRAVAGLLPLELGSQLVTGWLRRRLRGGGPLQALLSILSGGRRGMTERIQTLLVMGNDDDEGSIVLNDDRAVVEWPGAGTRRYYERANSVVGSAASTDGGTFLHSPIWSRWLHHSLITVHPLGGCVMADRAEDGVVDDRGRVFCGPSGAAVHEGLLVWDGSIVPRPLGVNPLLTISALAERGVFALAQTQGWKIDESSRPPAHASGKEPVVPDRPGLRFTERMAGFWSATDSDDLDAYQRAASDGAALGSTLAFELTLGTDDLRAEVSDLSRPMTAVGTVEAPTLSDQPLTVVDGQFQLMVADDADNPKIGHMWYRLPLVAVDGRRFDLTGFKVVAPGGLDDVWAATTTLYVTVRQDGSDGRVLGRGVLRIKPQDFARQLRTLSVTGPVGARERLALEARFGRAFAGSLYEHYGPVVHRPARFDRHATPRRRRPLDLPRRQEFEYRTADGVTLRLARYQGGERGPVLLVHGMGANPLTFMLDTIQPNMAEYLVAHGFDVWIQEWRGSTLLPTAHTQFTADDVARHDHAAVQAAIRDQTGSAEVHVVSHCVGSITWMMATLAGTVAPTSLLCSSVGMHPVGPALTRIKAGLLLAQLMKGAGIRELTTDSFTDESMGARLLDQALRAYPVPRSERCNQTVCKRLAFIYGIAIRHANVNESTHSTMHELFGPTDMTMMAHLSRMARVGLTVSAEGSDNYSPNLERLRRPITFLSGKDNLVWTPESTERTFSLLVSELGPDPFRRVVIEGYGHQDVFIGAQAARDTFPTVLEHLDRVDA